ncbi:hypothetical protein DNTS_001420 [Danionella cerebrum]|uniref:Lebercilin domain-containing protein n=1 Tax=Danionella cerebrum TaxID=2873325 RepID=A0A553R469_9TELE|nr:hypothetical protein DNTS_001420 [Danionella translucida]
MKHTQNKLRKHRQLMNSRRRRGKPPKNVRDVCSNSEKDPSLELTILEKSINCIPSGRQLYRTPPCKSERLTVHQLDKPEVPSPASEQTVIHKPCAQGMQGYRWTETDLEFVHETTKKKRLQQAQKELRDIQKVLKKKQQIHHLAITTHEKLQLDLAKVHFCNLDIMESQMPSSERIQQISLEVLQRSQNSSQLKDLDLKALVGKLKCSDVVCTVAEEKAEVSRLKAELERSQSRRKMEEQHLTKDIENCKESINRIKVNLHSLAAEITTLESQLSCKEEEFKSARTHQTVSGLQQLPSVPKTSKASAVPKSTKTSSFAPKHSKSSAFPKTSKNLSATSDPKHSDSPKTLHSQNKSISSPTMVKKRTKASAVKTSKSSTQDPTKQSPATIPQKPSSGKASPHTPNDPIALNPSKRLAARNASKGSLLSKPSADPKHPKPSTGPSNLKPSFFDPKGASSGSKPPQTSLSALSNVRTLHKKSSVPKTTKSTASQSKTLAASMPFKVPATPPQKPSKRQPTTEEKEASKPSIDAKTAEGGAEALRRSKRIASKK